MLHKLVDDSIKMRYYPFVPPESALKGEDEHRFVLRKIADFLDRLGRDLSKIDEATLPEELRYRTMDGFLGPMSGWYRTKFDLETAYCTLRAMLDGDITAENPYGPPPAPDLVAFSADVAHGADFISGP